MVRLQQRFIGFSFNSYNEVSIPLWFDYNKSEYKTNDGNIVSLNSTMVRLQPIFTLVSRVNPMLSQFHYGSITTCQKPCIKQKAGSSLNSTMVRLQPLFFLPKVYY